MEGTWLFLILQHKPLSAAAAAVCAFGDAERIGERGETYMEREVRGEVREMRGWGGGVVGWRPTPALSGSRLIYRPSNAH